MGYFTGEVQKTLFALVERDDSRHATLMTVGFAFGSTMDNIREYINDGKIDTSEIDEILSILLQAISHEDDFVTNRVSYGIYKIGKPSIPALIESLKDERKYVKKRIASLLSSITGNKFFFGNQSHTKWKRWFDINE